MSLKKSLKDGHWEGDLSTTLLQKNYFYVGTIFDIQVWMFSARTSRWIHVVILLSPSLRTSISNCCDLKDGSCVMWRPLRCSCSSNHKSLLRLWPWKVIYFSSPNIDLKVHVNYLNVASFCWRTFNVGVIMSNSCRRMFCNQTTVKVLLWFFCLSCWKLALSKDDSWYPNDSSSV